MPTNKPTLMPVDALLHRLGLPLTPENRAAVEAYTEAVRRKWIARLVSDARELARLHERALSKEY